MATDLEWEVIARRWDPASRSCILELRDRIEALEAAQNLQQQDEDVERVAGDPPIATDEEILRVYWAGGNSSDHRLRHVYDLGRKHGATQATCPHVRSSDEGTSYCALAELRKGGRFEAWLMRMDEARAFLDSTMDESANTCPAIQSGEGWYPSFADWLEREMPEGTVIGDPLWWASKIATYLQFHARPTIEPVPVAKRLPGPKDCFPGDYGQRSYKCWAQQYHTDSNGEPLQTVAEAWDLVDYRLLARCRRWYFVWLPHHALPIPTSQEAKK